MHKHIHSSHKHNIKVTATANRKERIHDAVSTVINACHGYAAKHTEVQHDHK